MGHPVILDPEVESPVVRDFEAALAKRVVGQERAVRRLARIYQVYQAGLEAPGRPMANLLLLGPTGSGKTRLAEAAAETLFGHAGALLKIDCAEFQHGHEIAKLVGSPPGYLGHRETRPLITQEALDAHQTKQHKLSLVLFDEIEKASETLWQLLLGILDKATLTLGDNSRVDFSRCLIFLTSNLGSREMMGLMRGGIGFGSGAQENREDFDGRIYRAAMEAARRKFSPEFMNRMDAVVVFRPLERAHLEGILDIELTRVQDRILSSVHGKPFIFRATAGARDLLLREGTDRTFGARHLKRAIERYLVFPLANLVATGQIEAWDTVIADYDPIGSRLTFLKEERRSLKATGEVEVEMAAAA